MQWGKKPEVDVYSVGEFTGQGCWGTYPLVEEVFDAPLTRSDLKIGDIVVSVRSVIMGQDNPPKEGSRLQNPKIEHGPIKGFQDDNFVWWEMSSLEGEPHDCVEEVNSLLRYDPKKHK